MKRDTFIITGGTGFLGSLLSVELLKKGNEVIFFIRSKDGEKAEKRIEKKLSEIYKDANPEYIHVLDINIFSKDLGLSDKDLQFIKNKNIKGIWHLAANISFKEKDKEDVFTVNARSMDDILNFASQIKIPIFFTSTAYVHGKNGGVMTETGLHKPKKFNNPYEESKFRAESIILEWNQKNSNNKFIIFRPSLLVEKKKTVFSLSGYYVVVASLYRLKNNLEKFNKKHPFLSKLLGIKNENGTLKTKIPFIYSKKGHLNLIPVDMAIDWMIEITEDKNSFNKIFHIINPNPFLMKDIVENTFKAVKIQFPAFPANDTIITLYIYLIKISSLLIKSLGGFANKLNYYKFYMSENRTFEIKNSRNLINYGKYSKMDLDQKFIEDTATSFIKKLDNF